MCVKVNSQESFCLPKAQAGFGKMLFTQIHSLCHVPSLTCCPFCSPWWKASQSQPAGHPSGCSHGRLFVLCRNIRARRGAESPSLASAGTAAHTHSIASTNARTPQPGSYLGERQGKKINDAWDRKIRNYNMSVHFCLSADLKKGVQVSRIEPALLLLNFMLASLSVDTTVA